MRKLKISKREPYFLRGQGDFFCSCSGTGKRQRLMRGLAISFSMWQCAGHGIGADTGWWR